VTIVTEAEPLHCPLQSTFVCVPDVVIAGGCVMLNVCVAVQPPEAVTVHVYVPAHNPVAVAAVPPDGAHEYVNGPVPATMLVVAEPLHCPLQTTLV
jgi:hypothetical protein